MTTLKVLALNLLTVTVVNAFVVTSSSAESQSGGHFVVGSAPSYTELDVKENPPSGTHMLELTQPGFTGIVCHEASYVAPIVTATVTDVTATPTYKGCLTTGKGTGEVTVHTNGCTYTFLQPNKEAAKTEHTVQIVCPAGKTIQVTHATCTVSIAPQTLTGIGYTTTSEALPGEAAKHAITLTANLSFPVTREGGFCSLLATNSTGTLKGSATVFGTDFATGKQVDITAEGSIN